MSEHDGRGGATARPHALIVSDDPDLQQFLSEGLLLGGFWVSGIASAIQTLEVFRLRGFDLVLIDARLAGLGAIELIRRLRGRSGRSGRSAPEAPRTDVPILLVTDVPEATITSEAAVAGSDGVLVAPLELERLLPDLHRIVAGWRAAHPDRPWADQAAQQRPA